MAVSTGGGDDSDPGDYFSGDRSAKDKVRKSLQAIRPFVPEGCRILDVGGGDGSFSTAAHLAGFDSWMLEVGEGGFERLRQSGVKPITSIPQEKLGTFDVVTLWDVYEHVWPHRDFFRMIYEALRAGGVLIFECPMPSQLVLAFFVLGHLLPSPKKERAWMKIANYTHIQICTPKEIRATLPSHGFEIVHLRTESNLSHRGVEYAQRHIRPHSLARVVGGLFDIPLIRRIVLGHNKSFVVARKKAHGVA